MDGKKSVRMPSCHVRQGALETKVTSFNELIFLQRENYERLAMQRHSIISERKAARQNRLMGGAALALVIGVAGTLLCRGYSPGDIVRGLWNATHVSPDAARRPNSFCTPANWQMSRQFGGCDPQ
jgi:hypothetical protein